MGVHVFRQPLLRNIPVYDMISARRIFLSSPRRQTSAAGKHQDVEIIKLSHIWFEVRRDLHDGRHLTFASVRVTSFLLATLRGTFFLIVGLVMRRIKNVSACATRQGAGATTWGLLTKKAHTHTHVSLLFDENTRQRANVKGLPCTHVLLQRWRHNVA